MNHIFMYGDDWVRHLAVLLNEKAQGHYTADACEYPEINPFRILRKAWRADVLMRVGVRPGAPGKRLLLLDLLWLILYFLSPRKRLIFYWIGTDVLEAATQSGRAPSWRSRVLTSLATHFSNAPWLRDELCHLGIESRLVLFPVGKVSPPAFDEIKWGDPFMVLAYVPDQRFKFYGGDTLLAVARKLPDVQFVIVGGSGSWASDKPSNVQFMGFVNNMQVLFNRAHVVVRQVQHDAIGGTVREGLFYGRHVIYSYRLPHTIFVPWRDEHGLFAEISAQYENYVTGKWLPNWAGREYAINQWSPDALFKAFLTELTFEKSSITSTEGS